MLMYNKILNQNTLKHSKILEWRDEILKTFISHYLSYLYYVLTERTRSSKLNLIQANEFLSPSSCASLPINRRMLLLLQRSTC